MAIVSSPNRTCASDDLMELYQSYKYIASTSMNIMVPILSLYFLGRTIYKLCAQSIIQHSTRVLLVSTMLFAICHQVSYCCAKVDLLHTILFKLSDSCNLQRTSYDCRFISIGQTTGNCGMVFIQISMSVDRALNLLFPKNYYKFKSYPGIVLAIISFSASFSMWFFLTMNDPLTGYLNNCLLYPSNSVRQFNIMLYVISGLSVSNVVSDTILLKLAQREILWKRSYDFKRRFNAKISLKCSKAVFWISICECFTNLASHGLMALFMQIGKLLQTSSYMFLLSIAYVAPYGCLVLPILISYLLVYIRDQTTVGILSLTSTRHNTEDHMARLKQAWS